MKRPMTGLQKELQYLASFFRERPAQLLGVAMTLTFVSLMFFGYKLAPYDPMMTGPDFLEPPSMRHWLGTDKAGMDVFSRIIAAPRIDLTIGIVATLCAVTIGIPIGVITGYWHGWASSSIARAMDVVQCLPTFILALSLVAFAGQSATNVIIVLAVLNVPIFARLVRAETYTVTQRLFVEAAVSTGNSGWRIIFRHLLPNSLRPVLIQIPVNVGWAVLMTAGLSFLGAGIRPPTPEWGAMIASGAPLLITGQWWVALFPGIALGLCGLGLGLTGSALEILLDPTRR